MSKFGDFFAKLLRLRKVLKGLDKFIKQDIDVPVTTFGNNGAAWTLIPELLNESSIAYSFGVGTDISFDLSLINHLDLQIFAFDPTPQSIDWIATQKLPKQFSLHPVGLANFNGKAKFHPPKNSNHVSATMLEVEETKEQAYKVEVKTLATIMSELGHSNIDLLKMDVEGMEYDVIEDMKNVGLKPAQVLIEFHHRFKGVGIKKTVGAVNTMRQMGYKVFHVSRTGEEIAFVKEEMIHNLAKLN
ncbi:MAG: FkbM family methyltransferase [Bacteroidales bacterium]|nr:FkbM family methyltransferase [Bacteroidales bacterium]